MRAGRLLVATGLVALAALAATGSVWPGPAKEPILGRWELGGGVFEFVQQRPGTFVSRVIRKRPGVPCRAVNDRDGQIVLRKAGARVYRGTWVWFLTPACRPAGKGATTVTVAPGGRTATMLAEPPRGVDSPTLTLTLSRPGAAAPATKLFGTVGPGFTIRLSDAQGLPVQSLKAGRYSFTVDDRSELHNFHLRGPGVDTAITTVPFVGRRTFTATLRPGVYTFLCDPHAPQLQASFRVTSPRLDG